MPDGPMASYFWSWPAVDLTLRWCTRSTNSGEATLDIWLMPNQFSDRFVNIAINFPELLTHTEDYQWKEISENKDYWIGQKPNYELIRENYEEIKTRAEEKTDD